MVAFHRYDLHFILTGTEMNEVGRPIVKPLLPLGLCTVKHISNNDSASQSSSRAADKIFMQIKEPLPQNALFSTSYTSSSGLVTPDVEPRVISNRISVEAANNSAAVIPQAISFTILGVGFQNPTQAAGPP